MAAIVAISRSRVSRVFRRLRGLNQFSNHQSTFPSTRKKQSNAAFLLGFGLAGLVGFSGILFYGKKQRKRITAASGEKHSLAEEHCSSQSVSNVEETNNRSCSPWTLQSAIEESQSIIRCMKEETGSPGVCVAVSIDGKTVWSEGFGFADVENRVLCSSKAVMRIASISKPLTATAAAKLWEDGKLDLDVPIQKYVASFPEKTFRGTPVTLTTRQLLSHLGGIRHYKKNKSSNEKSKTENQSKNSNASKEQVMASTDTRKSGTIGKSCTCTPDSPEEFYIKDHYDTVTEAISIFKDDPLLSDPGTSYLYTTHGWTLLSAVIEGASGEDFLLFMKKLFKELGMENTCAEFNDRIIYNRARFYQRNNQGRLINAPYVDNSHKWGGGGFMSNVEDLVQFGNSMLYAKQMSGVNKENFGATGYLPGFLQPETVSELWRIVVNTEGKGHKDGGYGMGWVVIPEKQDFGSCYHQSETVLHDGGAVGASSILLIRPHHVHNKPPKGVVVVLLVNLQRVKLEKTAMDVASCFEKTKL